MASIFRFICLRTGDFLGAGVISKKEWKYLVSCLTDILVLVRSIKDPRVLPVVIHLTKSLKYLLFLEEVFLELEKNRRQLLHLNLKLVCLSLPHLIVFLDPQNLQEK